MSEYILCTFFMHITTVVWMWIGFIICIAFYMGSALHLCERGLCECELVLYVDVLFNGIDGLLCGCELVSGCGFV